MRAVVTAVFRDPDAALRGAERVRQLDGAAGSVRLFLPGERGEPVETLMVRERPQWLRLGGWGVAVGLVFSYVARSLSPSWIYVVVALAAGVGFGLMLGGWLGGPRYARPLRPHMRARYLDLVQRGRAVVLVDVVGRLDEVRSLMEESGAYVSEGYWPVRDDGLQPV